MGRHKTIKELLPEPKPKVLSGYKQIAAILGVSVRTIIRHWKSIPCITKRDNKLWVVEEDLLNWVRENPRLYRHRQKPEFYGITTFSTFFGLAYFVRRKEFCDGASSFQL